MHISQMHVLELQLQDLVTETCMRRKIRENLACAAEGLLANICCKPNLKPTAPTNDVPTLEPLQTPPAGIQVERKNLR